MPNLWKPELPKVYREWIDQILNHGKDVTPWEQSFTKSLQSWLDKNGKLSQKQAETLEKIYSEKT